MDPRLVIINKRIINVDRLIAVSGGKGGIGKSMVSSTLALTLSKLGYKVGLLDLDFCSPSAHVILGINGIYPEEKNGIIPPEIYGMKFMSVVYYAGNNPSPLRGIDVSNAIIELLAITLWDKLDFLVIDMPPGIGDALLDTIRLMKRAEFLIVTTQSIVTLETVKKVLSLLKELRMPIIGIIENMKFKDSSLVKEQLKRFNLPVLGEILFDKDLEESLGNINKLIKTEFAQNIKKIILHSPEFKLNKKL